MCKSEGLFGGKQDPYAVLKVGDGSVWQHTTDVREDGGSYAMWNLNFSSAISSADAGAGKLIIKALDKDPKRDKAIGKVAIDLQGVLSSPNVWMDLSGELQDDGKKSGLYTVRVRFLTAQAKQFPKLEVRELALTNLVNTGE